MDIYKIGNVSYKVFCILISIAFIASGLGAIKNHVYMIGLLMFAAPLIIIFKFYKKPSRKNFWYVILILLISLYVIGKAVRSGYMI